MILQFNIHNFRSFKSVQKFDMQPTKLTNRKSKVLSVGNSPAIECLPSSILYGPNNAGKSNFIKALAALKWLVLKSHNFQPDTPLKANEYFKLDIQTLNKPTTFEILFVVSNVKYLYLVSFDQKEIIKEELHHYNFSEKGKNTKRKLFIRNKGKNIDFGEDLKGPKKEIENVLNSNQLFLSKAVNNKSEQLLPIYNFFTKTLLVDITLNNEGYSELQFQQMVKFIAEKGENFLNAFGYVLEAIDSGILGLRFEQGREMPDNFRILIEDEMPEDEKRKIKDRFLEIFGTDVKAMFRLFDGENQISTTEMPLKEQSVGTQKFMTVFGRLIEVLEKGAVLIVDELDKSFHSLITRLLLELMNNPSVNSKGAQLIFTTHDATLLDSDLIDKDQIYIVEKNRRGETELFRLSDHKGLRNDIPLEKWYLSGKLNGIPIILSGHINNIIIETNHSTNESQD